MRPTLSAQQESAADAVLKWFELHANGYDASHPFFYLAGAAGTGKTTIAYDISQRIDGYTRFAAYTGKAARVLRSKDCPATTIHGLIYLPLGDVNEEILKLDIELMSEASPPKPARQQQIIRRLTELREPQFVKKSPEQLEGVNLLILDECSMIDNPIAVDLMSYKIPILVLGDPYQLPPIKGHGYFTQREPDFLLTEIHRQAAESPVIRLATMAREKRRLPSGAYGTSKVMTLKGLNRDDALGAHQLICGSNKARAALIEEVRTFLDFSGPFPEEGEKLICLRNNAKRKPPILNGEMFTTLSDYDEDTDTIRLLSEDGDEFKVSIHPECFTQPELVQAWAFSKRKFKEEFDYGWAITGHKSQGSEWPSVLVYADMFKWNHDLFACWLYTSITRAQERVIVCL